MAQQQGDYRIFIGAFPTGALAEEIQMVRTQYDAKTARITAPHVTLAGTYWRRGPATPANEAAAIANIEEAVQGIRPFTLTLGGIRTFGGRVVYLAAAADAGMLAARRALLTALGGDKHRRFVPHLTLAMRLKRPQVDQMVAELRQSVWENGRFSALINTLYLMQRGPADPAWRKIASFELGE